MLFSPIANEDLVDRKILAGARNNGNIRKYCDVMEKVAAATKTPFIDLFTPTLAMFDQAKAPLTINGIHLTAQGDDLLARQLPVRCSQARSQQGRSCPAEGRCG